jgi:hypothetical protein
MVAASLCGASNATEFSLFAQERKPALSRLIEYEVAPSHDTFSRLLRLLDPVAFGQAFAAFAAGFAQACQGWSHWMARRCGEPMRRDWPPVRH